MIATASPPGTTMRNWLQAIADVEALEDLHLDTRLVERMSVAPGAAGGRIDFYTPTFKFYETAEISACGKSLWPAVSITGGACQLACDHCKAKILEPMIPARTPDELWRVINREIGAGARGMLLTGGSNRRNEVEYGPFYPVIRRAKDAFPTFRIAVHTALVDENIARRMEAAGFDCAMMDVIGSQDTIAQVYHLRRSVTDFERSLECLMETSMKVVPHIVMGLHYGRMFGEWNALEIVARHRPDALVLVAVMPFYAPANRPFATLSSSEIGRFFLDARQALPGLPLLLGCARPTGTLKAQIDAYAVMAGLNGIAHPADGIVELAARLQRDIRVSPACCSMAIGEGALALEAGSGLAPDVERFIERERAARLAARGLAGIRVVARGA